MLWQHAFYRNKNIIDTLAHFEIKANCNIIILILLKILELFVFQQP